MTIEIPFEIPFSPMPYKKKAISLGEFLKMLRVEEDYFIGEQRNTKLMTTRLRKIFYDKYGWDSEIIGKAAHIVGRYDVKLVSVEDTRKITVPKERQGKYSSRDYNVTDHKIRLVTVKKGDWMRPFDEGKEAFIYEDDNQEVILPSGWFCDMGHVLTGIDAYNWLDIVAPFAWLPVFIRKMLPHVNHNTDVATWLGDIASASGEFLFEIFHRKEIILNKKISEEERGALLERYAPDLPQKKRKNLKWRTLKRYLRLDDEIRNSIIADYAPAQDMLGNIDSYVMYSTYNTKSAYGIRVSDIFHDYYIGNGEGQKLRENRYIYFAEAIGLQGWDGEGFSNEKDWFDSYFPQLRDCTAMYVYTRSEKPFGYWLTFKTWIKGFDEFLDLEPLLTVFLANLKAYIIKDSERKKYIDESIVSQVNRLN